MFVFVETGVRIDAEVKRARKSVNVCELKPS